MSDIHHGRSCGAYSPPRDKLRERSLPCPCTRIRVGAFRWILNKSSSSGSLRTCTPSTPRHTPGRRRSSLPLQPLWRQPYHSGSHAHTRACVASSAPSDTASSSSALAGNGCIDSAQLRSRSPRRSPCSDGVDLVSYGPARLALRSRIVRGNARLRFCKRAPTGDYLEFFRPSLFGGLSEWSMRATARQARLPRDFKR